MFPNDYVMRQIELLVWGLAKIMGLKQENRLEEAVDLYQATLRKFFGLTEQAVEELPWSDLMAVASLGGLPDYERCALLAQLIAEKADVGRLRGADESALYLKALCISLVAVDQSEQLQGAEHARWIDEWLSLLGRVALPEGVLGAAFRHFWRTGQYARAEDVLYEMLDAGLPGSGDEGVAFYQALLAMPDQALALGGLPREEALDGLDSLKKRISR